MLTNVFAWLHANPAAWGFLVGLLGAIFNWLCKPRSATEYSAMSPRRAAFFRFMAGTFPDPQKSWESITNLVKGIRPLTAPTVITTVAQPGSSGNMEVMSDPPSEPAPTLPEGNSPQE